MRTSRTPNARRIGLFAFLPAAAMAVVLAGCGDGRLPLYYVTGNVLVDGRAAEGAIVIFCPVDASEQLANLRPAGKTDSSGQFQLTTYDPADGAPAGQYKVLIKWPTILTAAENREGRAGALGPDRLKGKYYDLETTPFSATIEEQSNEIAPFELRSR